MDSFCFMLQKIRDEPGLYLGRKSLEALKHFWSGYDSRRLLESVSKAWEESAEPDFSKYYDEAVRTSTHFPICNFRIEFNEFVLLYYNDDRSSLSGICLIAEHSDSDQAGFDKFFELFDAFLKWEKKGVWGPALYQNEISEDIFEQFLSLRDRGKNAEEITQILIEKYANVLDDSESAPIFWSSLASCQLAFGELLPEAKRQALAWLDKGGDLEKWKQEKPEQAPLREKALRGLRDEITYLSPSY